MRSRSDYVQGSMGLDFNALHRLANGNSVNLRGVIGLSLTDDSLQGQSQGLSLRLGVTQTLHGIAMEKCEATDAFAARFPVITAVVPGSRWQAECNGQDLSSFRSYRPERTFPTAGRTAA